jgi:hypothetical protein
MTVRSIEVNGARARWSRTEQELTVIPKSPIEGGDFEVKVGYGGVPHEFEIPGVELRAGFMTTPDGATVAGQPEVAAGCPGLVPSATTRSARRVPTVSSLCGSAAGSRAQSVRPGADSDWPPTLTRVVASGACWSNHPRPGRILSAGMTSPGNVRRRWSVINRQVLVCPQHASRRPLCSLRPWLKYLPRCSKETSC